jgi:hypothetical protein
VDPISIKYPMLTPYQFASNCPISGIDMDGLEFYYAADGSFLGQGSDPTNTEVRLGMSSGKAKSGANIVTAVDLQGNQVKQWVVIHNNHDEFKAIAGVMYAEADGKSSQAVNEVAGIYSVVENRAQYEKTSILEQLTVAKGVNGVSEADKINTEKGPAAVAKRKAVYSGLILGMLSESDYSNGAFYWDGKDFNGKNPKHGGHTQRYTPGFVFTHPSHDLFKQKNNKVSNTLHGVTYDYKYESTAAWGKTTFSKLNSSWKDAQYSDKKEKNGSTTKREQKPVGNGYDSTLHPPASE